MYEASMNKLIVENTWSSKGTPSAKKITTVAPNTSVHADSGALAPHRMLTSVASARRQRLVYEANEV